MTGHLDFAVVVLERKRGAWIIRDNDIGDVISLTGHEFSSSRKKLHSTTYCKQSLLYSILEVFCSNVEL